MRSVGAVLFTEWFDTHNDGMPFFGISISQLLGFITGEMEPSEPERIILEHVCGIPSDSWDIPFREWCSE